MFSPDTRHGQNDFPPFEAWKASLNKAFETRGFPDYIPSLSILEQWYVPSRTAEVAIPDRVVYQAEKMIHNVLSLGRTTPQLRPHKALLRLALLDLPIFK